MAHLKALNVQVVKWISSHVDKNPYVFLTSVFKDYDKHLADIEKKYGSETPKDDQPKGFTFGAGSSMTTGDKDKPLLGKHKLRSGTFRNLLCNT